MPEKKKSRMTTHFGKAWVTVTPSISQDKNLVEVAWATCYPPYSLDRAKEFLSDLEKAVDFAKVQAE